MIKRILLSCATLGPLGYAPCSGTVASSFTLFIAYACSSLSFGLYEQCILLTALMFISLHLSSYALNYFNSEDPSQVVIDEALGSLVTFVGIPFRMESIILGFLLFRFFDISKCLGIKKIESLKNGWGIILDDVAAGVLSNVILRCILLLLI